MNAPIYVLFVEVSDRFLSKAESLHLETCEKLCKEFGGEFLRVKSSDVPQAIAQVAAKYHITQIIIGESQRSWWKHFIKGSFLQQLMRLIRGQHIDLHVIATES